MHTEGMLSLDGKYIIDEIGQVLGIFGGTNPESRNRLVACWNFCDQIATEYLEVSIATEDTERLSNLLFSANERERKLSQERDELLMTLRIVFGIVGDKFVCDNPSISGIVETILAKYPEQKD